MERLISGLGYCKESCGEEMPSVLQDNGTGRALSEAQHKARRSTARRCLSPVPPVTLTMANPTPVSQLSLPTAAPKTQHLTSLSPWGRIAPSYLSEVSLQAQSQSQPDVSPCQQNLSTPNPTMVLYDPGMLEGAQQLPHNPTLPFFPSAKERKSLSSGQFKRVGLGDACPGAALSADQPSCTRPPSPPLLQECLTRTSWF